MIPDLMVFIVKWRRQTIKLVPVPVMFQVLPGPRMGSSA